MRYGPHAAFVNGNDHFFGVSSLSTSSWSRQICASQSPSSHVAWMWEQDSAKPQKKVWFVSEGDFKSVVLGSAFTVCCIKADKSEQET